MHFIGQKPLLTRIFIYYDISWHINSFTKCILHQTVALHTCKYNPTIWLTTLDACILEYWWFKLGHSPPKKVSPTYPTLQKRKGFKVKIFKKCHLPSGWGKKVVSSQTGLHPSLSRTKLHHGSCHLHICISTKFGHSSDDIGNTAQIEDFLPFARSRVKQKEIGPPKKWENRFVFLGGIWLVTNLAWHKTPQNN